MLAMAIGCYRPIANFPCIFLRIISKLSHPLPSRNFKIYLTIFLIASVVICCIHVASLFSNSCYVSPMRSNFLILMMIFCCNSLVEFFCGRAVVFFVTLQPFIELGMFNILINFAWCFFCVNSESLMMLMPVYCKTLTLLYFGAVMVWLWSADYSWADCLFNSRLCSFFSRLLRLCVTLTKWWR